MGSPKKAVGDSMDDVNTLAKEGLILQNYETQHVK
jgi:hypothetical protein